MVFNLLNIIKGKVLSFVQTWFIIYAFIHIHTENTKIYPIIYKYINVSNNVYNYVYWNGFTIC